MADKKELPLALLEILTKYTDKEHMLTTKEIVTILEEEYSLTCERRTIYSNIELLRQYGYSIGTWQENNIGYCLLDHKFSVQEATNIIESLKSNSSLTPRERKRITLKILSMMSDYQRKEIKNSKTVQ